MKHERRDWVRKREGLSGMHYEGEGVRGREGAVLTLGSSARAKLEARYWKI